MPRLPVLLAPLAPAALCILCAGASAQTGVQAHHADGQVWLRWTEDASPPETYAIYVRNSSFTNVSQAQLAGRLFREEWLPAMLQSQASGAPAGWVIPDGAGGRDTLASNQGLFVHTPVAGGPRWYAVVRWGDSVVTAGVHLAGPVNLPTPTLADPPEPQLQFETVEGGQWLLSWYAMWAHGQDDHRGGRPDFPIMANRHKNGMPSLFLLSRPLALPPGPRPLVHWLHGGGGTANQSRPGTRTSVQIDPVDGFLCSHNDDFIRRMQGAGVITQQSNSWHFGWATQHDPFDSAFVTPALTDTVINYTQRRYAWIDGWIRSHFPIDSMRIAVQGHSVGSAGTTAWGKADPARFSTVTIFNNGMLGPEPAAVDELPPGGAVPGGVNLFGYPADSLPTNLRRAGGGVVRAYELFDLITPTSPLRDLPLFRSLHGKLDDNGTMRWDAGVVGQYRAADSLALGMHLYWDERTHGLGAAPSYFSHGTLPADQTRRDDVVYQWRHRKNASYPAFFNHRLHPDSRDPGDGTLGTTTQPPYSGDDWGTWGGFHEWEPDSITDTATLWETKLWLISGSAWLPDNCPYESLTCDVAIRRPQAFLPAAGSPVDWRVVSAAGDTLQSGTSTVAADGLVSAPGIRLRRDPERRRLRFSPAPALGVGNPRGPADRFGLWVAPVPVRGTARITYRLPRAGNADLAVFDVQGRRLATLATGAHPAGVHGLPWSVRDLAAGVYLLRFEFEGGSRIRRAVVLP